MDAIATLVVLLVLVVVAFTVLHKLAWRVVIIISIARGGLPLRIAESKPWKRVSALRLGLAVLS